MKLTMLFLTAAFVNVSAHSVSQTTITYSGKNTSLVKVFSVIKEQTGFAVVYPVDIVAGAPKVNVHAINQPLEDFLGEVFEHQRLTWTIKSTTIFISKKVRSPQITPAKTNAEPAPVLQIRGRVVGEKGEALAGVSIVVKGTNVGTVSDNSGQFVLNTREERVTLVFSSTGYETQEVETNGANNLNVTLKLDTRNMSEVVVTAFGVERSKRALGYSTQSVDGSKLAEAREPNVANALKGKVAGVHINGSSAGAAGSSFVVIRGNSSLTGNNQPLYVVDGVPIDNQTLGSPGIFSGQRDFGDGIGDINPDDIENVSVLKGPAAAALYGARGAHGVILITSKKGKSGRMNIDFNTNATFETLNVIPTFQNKWGGGYDDNHANFDQVTIDGQTVSQWPGWLIDNWGGEYDGRPLSIATWPELGIIPYTPQPGNVFKNFYRTGATLTNTVGISGGSDRGTYRLSLSDLRNRGIVPNNSFNRQTINLLVNFKVTPKLTVETKINYIRQDESNPPETGGLSTSPAAAINRLPLFLDLEKMKNYKREDGSMINYKSGSPLNPYWIMNELIAEGDRDRIIGYILGRYQFTNWLTLQARTGTDFYTDTRFSRIGIGTPGTADGSLQNETYSVKEDNSDLLLTATGNLNSKWTGTLSLGANHLDRRYERLATSGFGFNIPNLYNIGNAKRVVSNNTESRRIMNSAYFAGQIGYNNFLFVDITGRNDWSSTLGTNNYSFFYPSVSASFVFTDALNMSAGPLSFGKLRASYAEAGNDAAPFLTKGGYDITSSNYNGAPFAFVNTNIPLQDLKNELTRSYEVGTELRFFNNRLNLDLTYYNASTVNQITPVQISMSTGFQSRLINAGEIRNQGFEIFASGTPVKLKDFSWDISLNFSRNKSRVVSLAPGLATLTLLSADPVSIEARPGQAYGNIVGFPFMRNDAGEILLTAEGKWQPAAQREILGNIQPDWLGGITNTFTFKGVELRMLIDVRQGGQVYSMSKYNQMAGGTGKFTENRENLIANGVIEQPDGKFVKSDKVLLAQDYYALMGPWSGIAEPLVIDADYVSFREASIGYSFANLPWLKRSILKTAKLSVVGRNLFYIYRDPEFKLMGVTPETAFNTTAAAQGVEAANFPTTRSVGVNLSFSF
ncbi:MAG: SusC/RagA family TonB-linked outer membrane protein [Chitinophagaceae bacterium]|nr:SusC/RagA family TonB-linked outer membrane protein [Chitinophagaceae bacterium]